uniref:5,10-methylenetetrahydrofolate reductase n=1 Tax=Candidatus Methanomethylicus mesodigestus TaxID=1867258 RepID=A0A7C3ES69_9CREN
MVDASSNLMRALKSGAFVFTGEVSPQKTSSTGALLESARSLRRCTIACNVTDNPRARANMSSIAASHLIQEMAGVEAICQMTVRDRNRIALTSDLLGAASLGIRNVLTMTGDHTVLGDNPGAKPVYDIDTAQFVKLIRGMVDAGIDLAGNKIDGKPLLHVGITANPNADPLEPEIAKIERKIDLGAEFIQTQAVFDMENVKRFMGAIGSMGVPVILGIFICRSCSVAELINRNLPGIKIPDELVSSLKKAESNGGRANGEVDRINVDYYGGLIREIRKTTSAAGVHIMAINYDRIVNALYEELKSELSLTF